MKDGHPILFLLTGEDIFPTAIAFDSTGTRLAICYREYVQIIRTSDLAEISRHDKRSGISNGLALDSTRQSNRLCRRGRCRLLQSRNGRD